MKRHFAFFLWLFLLVFSFYWFSLSPTIKPADIELTGIIKPARLSENPKDTDEGYIVEINFNKKTDKPLYVNDTEYFYDIYTMVDGHRNLAWDFFQGRENGKVKGDIGYSFGNDSRTLQMAATKLKDLGILDNDTPHDVTKLSIGHDGFAYLGNKFPQRVRYYLLPIPIENTPDPNKSFLIYCHYEIKWGKNLTWAKEVPLEMVEE